MVGGWKKQWHRYRIANLAQQIWSTHGQTWSAKLEEGENPAADLPTSLPLRRLPYTYDELEDGAFRIVKIQPGSRNDPIACDIITHQRVTADQYDALSYTWCVTCYALATHRPIYSYFPAFRARSFLYIIPIYTYIIPTAPSGHDMGRPQRWTACLSG
jgi:hypothetical protein